MSHLVATYKQTNKHTNKQASKQTNQQQQTKRTNQTNKQTSIKDTPNGNLSLTTARRQRQQQGHEHKLPKTR